jgi:hypothetical protein
LSGIAAACALVVTPLHAQTVGAEAELLATGLNTLRDAEIAPGTFDPFHLRPAELGGLCAVESVVSLIAAHLDELGSCAFRNYDVLVMTTNGPAGIGFANINFGPPAGTTLNFALEGPATPVGVRCMVNAAAGSNLTPPVSVLPTYGVTYTTETADPPDGHRWGLFNSKFLSRANIVFTREGTDFQSFYDEHNIKDFYSRLIEGRLWTFDWGLELITKDQWPRSKWIQWSRWIPSDGGLGDLRIVKRRVNPRSAADCNIVFQPFVFAGAEEFFVAGAVTVGPEAENPANP